MSMTENQSAVHIDDQSPSMPYRESVSQISLAKQSGVNVSELQKPGSREDLQRARLKSQLNRQSQPALGTPSTIQPEARQGNLFGAKRQSQPAD